MTTPSKKPINSRSSVVLPEDPRAKVVALSLAMLAGVFFLFFWKGSFNNAPPDFIPPEYPRPEPVEKRQPTWDASVQLKNADGGDTQVRFSPELEADAARIADPDARNGSQRLDAVPRAAK